MVYFTSVELERLVPVKVLDPAETTQPAVPPRASSTVTAPRVPVMVLAATPDASEVSAAVPCTPSVSDPPVSVKVVAVSAAEAGRAPAATMAVTTAPRAMRLVRLIGDSSQ